ncbi:MAG TPA: hypothetical protein VJP02_31730 [Candidatus Sulfotelmatobacter sp.]|nr:hypothetical protein [Candidatus Sulfotelmatobacter sp.]
MVDPNLEKYQPSCLLAHELVNKLSAVVGYCDLLRDHVAEDSAQQQLRKIRELAKAMAEELNAHQCSIETMSREVLKSSLDKAQVTVQCEEAGMIQF